MGSGAGVVLYAAVRLSFLLSIISIFPMQMWPLRQALCKLVLGRELQGAPREQAHSCTPWCDSRCMRGHAHRHMAGHDAAHRIYHKCSQV